MYPTIIEIAASVLFALAILHTFLVKRFERLALRYPEGSVAENLFHMLGEVEIVFGLWAGLFLAVFVVYANQHQALHYLEGRNFTEPIFVFAIMTVAATRPVLNAAQLIIQSIARLLPFPRNTAFYISTLIIGPLAGSFITEPAAMTVTALILKRYYYDRGMSTSFMYATLGLLFVNVSIGGTLTSYAAPPVLMVAGKWGWGLTYMLSHFGWKAATAVIASTAIVAFRFRRELSQMGQTAAPPSATLPSPPWLIVMHVIFLVGIVMGAHHIPVFMGLFLFFLGFANVTREYQDELHVRQALLVAFFLAGLVILGGLQRWWLEPLLSALNAGALFLGATALTAVTDNAALTYLGSQVPTLTEFSKYALVAGSVTGGGLTVIANAPNPAGFGILNTSFGKEGISPIGLLGAALGPTLIAALCFWFLPSV